MCSRLSPKGTSRGPSVSALLWLLQVLSEIR